LIPKLLHYHNSFIYAFAMKGDSEVTSVLRRCDKIGICAVSIGELLYGFKGGRREKKTERNLSNFWTHREFFFTLSTKTLLNFILTMLDCSLAF